MMREREELLDIKQAAAFLNVSETSLRRWTNAGLLPCLRVGRRRERRFRRSDLNAFMEVESSQFAGLGGYGSAPAPRRGEHVCMLYSTDAGRTRLMVTSLAPALHEGSHCILIADRAVQEAVGARLRRDYPALKGAFDDGRITRAEYAPTAAAQLAFFAANFAAAMRVGAESIYVIGDTSGIAEHLTPQELVAYETAYERVANQYGVATGCLYDVRQCSGHQLLAALKGHRDTLSRPAEALLA
jgi:excisionase family DNA binding protein